MAQNTQVKTDDMDCNNFCVVCRLPVLKSLGFNAVHCSWLCYPIDKFVEVLFVFKKVLNVTDSRVEDLIVHWLSCHNSCDNFEASLLCDRCDQALISIIDILNQFVETCQDFSLIKQKLFPTKKRKRRVKVICDEDEDQVTFGFPSEEHPNSKPEQNVAVKNAEKMMKQLAMVYCSGIEGPSLKDPLGDDEEDGDSDPPYSPPPELCLNNEEVEPEPPKKRKYFRVKPKAPTDKTRAKHRRGPRGKYKKRTIAAVTSGNPEASKLTCPFCNAFSGTKDKPVELCRHLHDCSSANGLLAETTVTCATCNLFSTSDLTLISEHFGLCSSSSNDSKPVNLIPISDRIMKCECCSPPKYFKFEDFLQHYIYHQRFTYKCLFTKPDGSFCSSRWESSKRLANHWRVMHKCPKKPHLSTTDPPECVVETAVPSIPWFCQLCNSRFSSIELRNAHFTEEHSEMDTKLLKCDQCTFTAPLSEDISIHFTSCHPNLVKYVSKTRKSYQCDICLHYLPTDNDLKKHKKSVHKVGKGKVIKLYSCPDCADEFVIRTQLVSHQIRVHKRTDLGPDPMQCKICQKRLQRPANLLLHMNAMHQEVRIRKHFCEKCGKALASNQGLKKHLFVAHGEGNMEVFKCPEESCNKTYVSERELRTHVASNHTKTPLFNCEFCGKGYYSNSLLRKHLLYHKHPDFKAFSCGICPGRKFRTPENLRLHWKTHSPEDYERLKRDGIKKEEQEEFIRVVGEEYKSFLMFAG